MIYNPEGIFIQSMDSLFSPFVISTNSCFIKATFKSNICITVWSSYVELRLMLRFNSTGLVQESIAISYVGSDSLISDLVLAPVSMNDTAVCVAWNPPVLTFL